MLFAGYITYNRFNLQMFLSFRTNSDYFPTQYYLIGKGVSLLRGTCYIFTCVSI